MNGIKIITDCTSDLTPELYEKHDIDIIPLYVNIGGKSYADVVEINAEQLYQLVKEHGELPKTSAIPPATFTAYFKNILMPVKIFFTSGSDPVFGCFSECSHCSKRISGRKN